MGKVLDTAFVFGMLLRNMAIDNGLEEGVDWDAKFSDFDQAQPAIVALGNAGYFQGSPDDPCGDFWEMSAGEEQDTAIRFERAPQAFVVLNSVLNEIFDRPLLGLETPLRVLVRQIVETHPVAAIVREMDMQAPGLRGAFSAREIG